VLGPREGRLPGVVCVEVAGCEGESLLVNLDLEGIAVSTGSACAVGAAEPSPVLQAMGLSKKRAASTIRFSVGEGVGEADVDRAGAALSRLAERLRALAR
jgi:cysteine desulfurase